MKKLLGGATAVLVVITAIILFFNQPSEKEHEKKSVVAASKPKVTLVEAKSMDYHSLEELKSELPIAVKGVKTEEKENALEYSKIDNTLVGGHTVSNFKITEVLQNKDKDSNIVVGSTIPVMEYSFIDEEKNTTYSYNGYANMKEEEEYILFLLPKVDNLYAVGSLSTGKIPVEETAEVEIYQEELEENTEVFGDSTETIEEIENIYDDVRAEYLD